MKSSHWFVSLGLVLAACGGSSGAIPAAPSSLTVEPLSGGAHLTWVDNSSNETEFMIERKLAGGAYATLTTVPFNTTAYHDSTVVAGMTYTFHVMAMSTAGVSEPSNEGSLMATGTTPDDMGSAGSATCHQAGCRAFSSYCSTDACTCIPLIADHADPVCTGTTVSCLSDPCAGKTSGCNHGTGMCVLQ